MKIFHLVSKSFRDMKYVVANGIVIGDEVLRVGDRFTITERYCRTKSIKITWERRPNLLVEAVDTNMEIIDIECLGKHLDFVEPGVGCHLILQGNDNIRNNDVLLVKN